MTIYEAIPVAFLFISLSILLLVRLRSILGLVPLYMLLGAIQCLQAFSSTNLSFELWGKHTPYPESVILFSTVLFAVLLIYITEGVKRARATIIGVFIFNILLSVCFVITYVYDSFLGVIGADSSKAVFMLDYNYFITSTTLLLFESLFFIIFYQFLILKIKKNYIFLVLFIALSSVLIFDAFAFNILLKDDALDFKTSLTGHLIGMTITAFIFVIVLYIYVNYRAVENKNARFIANQNRDVFSILKYSTKHKNLKIDNAQVEKKTESQLESTLKAISDGFMSLDSNWCYTYVNKTAGEFFGKTPSQLLGKHIWTEFPQGVGLPFYEGCNKAMETQKTQRLEEYVAPFDKWYENRIYPSKAGLTICFIDITERKKTELALKESENHLRTLLESEPVCVKQLSDKAELIYMNSAGLAMIEADSLAMVKGKSVLELIVPAHQKGFKKLLSNVFKGNIGHLVFEIKGLKGSNRWLETHAVPLKNNTGGIGSFLGVTRDITNRKKVEDQVTKDEKLFRHLSSNAPGAIFQTDKVGSCNYVNEEWIKYAGLSFNEAMGYGWSNAIHPEDKERVLRQWQASVIDENDFVSEYRFQTKNNKITWLSVKVVATFDAQNNLYGYIGMALDITEQKQAEKLLKESKAYLKNIINNIGDPLFVKDEQSRLLLVNDAFCEIFNLQRKHVIGKTLAENVSPEEKEIFLRIDKQVMNTGIENINEETLTLKGKEKQIISTKKTRFIDANGNKFLIGIIRDITTRKKAETELENYRTKLEELIKIRTEEVNLKNQELQRMNKLFVGRELRMKELKTIIKEMQLKNDN